MGLLRSESPREDLKTSLGFQKIDEILFFLEPGFNEPYISHAVLSVDVGRVRMRWIIYEALDTGDPLALKSLKSPARLDAASLDGTFPSTPQAPAIKIPAINSPGQARVHRLIPYP